MFNVFWVLGFKCLEFRVEGFWGFGVGGFRVQGFRVRGFREGGGVWNIFIAAPIWGVAAVNILLGAGSFSPIQGG